MNRRRWRTLAASVFAFLLCVASARAADIRLKPARASETGIAKAMNDWKARELTRQGGKFGSHGWWPWGLRAFDLDNDGDLDLLPSHHGVPRSIVLKSLLKETGKLTFVDVTKELGIDSRKLPIADDRPMLWDIDGDRYIDIPNFSDESRVYVVFNRGGKKLEESRIRFHGVAHPEEVVDLNGDGYPDLDAGRLGAFIYDPKAKTFKRDKTMIRFPKPDGLPAELETLMVELKKEKRNRFLRFQFLRYFNLGRDTVGYRPYPIDLNGDGRGDLVFTGYAAYGGGYLARYLLTAADGKLADKTTQLGLPKDAVPIWIDDLTGDGAPEVLSAGKAGGFFVNDGTGKFTLKDSPMNTFLRKREPYLLRAFPADFDNDGDWDLVLSSPRYGRAEVYENKGGGEFKLILKARAWDSNPIVICDIDNDGKMDLLIGGAGKDRKTSIVVYRNETPHAGGFVQICPKMSPPNPFAVGAVVEVFKPGELGKEGTRPIFIEKAHADGTPVHAGLAAAATFDLRVTLPTKKVVEKRGLAGNRRLAIAPDGTVTPIVVPRSNAH